MEIQGKMEIKNECPICLELIEKKYSIILPCKHEFHKLCIIDWSKQNIYSSCPYCRKLSTEYSTLKLQCDLTREIQDFMCIKKIISTYPREIIFEFIKDIKDHSNSMILLQIIPIENAEEMISSIMIELCDQGIVIKKKNQYFFNENFNKLTICSICKYPIDFTVCCNDQENGRILLPCQHWFHHSCISEWFNVKRIKSCPYCQSDVFKLFTKEEVQVETLIHKYLVCEKELPIDIWKTMDLIFEPKSFWQEIHSWIKWNLKVLPPTLLAEIIENRLGSLVERGYILKEKEFYNYPNNYYPKE